MNAISWISCSSPHALLHGSPSVASLHPVRTRSILLGCLGVVFVLMLCLGGCSSGTDDSNIVEVPTPTPIPTPPPAPAPSFSKLTQYTLVLVVKIDPTKGLSGPTSKYFDQVRNSSSSWSGDFTETIYVNGNQVRREIDNLQTIYVNLYMPDLGKSYSWKTGSVIREVKGSVDQWRYTKKNPIDESVHLGWQGNWRQFGADEVLLGSLCHVYQLWEPDGGVFEVWAEASTGKLVHFQCLDLSVTCTVKSFQLGEPDPSVFTTPAGAFVNPNDQEGD